MLDHVFVATPPPPWWTYLAATLTAAALVGPRPLWRYTRNLVTVVHEAAHALVARLTGRRLSGIRLHSDTSGVTVSSGPPRGPGMVATAFAGYPGPAIAALGLTLGVHYGYSTATALAAAAALAAVALLVRNLYGLFLVASLGGAGYVAATHVPADQYALLLLTLAAVLAAGGVRTVAELAARRRRADIATSDAGQLSALTGLPIGFWLAAFQALNLACIATATLVAAGLLG